MADEFTFHLQHWPALGEWVIEPCAAIARGLCLADSGTRPGAPGLLGALSYCHQAARGRGYHLVISSRNERYELHSAPLEEAPPTAGWFAESPSLPSAQMAGAAEAG